MQEGFSVRSRPQASGGLKKRTPPLIFGEQLVVSPRPDPEVLVSRQDYVGKLPSWAPRKPGQAQREHKYLLSLKVCEVTLCGILSH